MYWRYSDQVVAAMVRSVPRASAGLSRLAASPVPGGPPAPISVWASSMNRMIGRRRSLHLVDDRAQPLLELALHRGARLHQADVERAQPHATQRRRHVAGGDALRKALDHSGLADAGFAGEDRIVLTPPHQHVDQLAGFRRRGRGSGSILPDVALRGQILGEAVERRRAFRASAVPLRQALRAARRPEPSIGRRFSSSEPRPDLAVFVGKRVDRDLVEFRRDICVGASQLAWI